jgi:hypothetical protein
MKDKNNKRITIGKLVKKGNEYGLVEYVDKTNKVLKVTWLGGASTAIERPHHLEVVR